MKGARMSTTMVDVQLKWHNAVSGYDFLENHGRRSGERECQDGDFTRYCIRPRSSVALPGT